MTVRRDVRLPAFVATLVAIASAAAAEQPRPLAVGDVLPPLRGEFLTGRDAELPAAAHGKIALLALGFTYDSRFAVEEWTTRFKDALGGRPDVTFFEVPMIGGFGRLGRLFIDRGMRKGTPEELHENVITVYGGTGDWKRRVRFREDDVAYLLLLDPEGHVRWMHAGGFDEQSFTALRETGERLLESTSR